LSFPTRKKGEKSGPAAAEAERKGLADPFPGKKKGLVPPRRTFGEKRMTRVALAPKGKKGETAPAV